MTEWNTSHQEHDFLPGQSNMIQQQQQQSFQPYQPNNNPYFQQVNMRNAQHSLQNTQHHYNQLNNQLMYCQNTYGQLYNRCQQLSQQQFSQLENIRQQFASQLKQRQEQINTIEKQLQDALQREQQLKSQLGLNGSQQPQESGDLDQSITDFERETQELETIRS